MDPVTSHHPLCPVPWVSGFSSSRLKHFSSPVRHTHWAVLTPVEGPLIQTLGDAAVRGVQFFSEERWRAMKSVPDTAVHLPAARRPRRRLDVGTCGSPCAGPGGLGEARCQLGYFPTRVRGG